MVGIAPAKAEPGGGDAFCCAMEPIDERITAAQLMAMRDDARAAQAIAELLRVGAMPPNLALRAKKEIAQFVETGDATLAAQLIHAAGVRRARAENSSEPKPGL